MSALYEKEYVETVVIGGGQAGLAVGYHLARRGLPFVILDAHDRIGDSWRKRWDSLLLFTPARYNGLPGMPFPASPRSFPTKDEMADYLEAYATRFDLPVRAGVKVDRLTRVNGRYLLTSSFGEFEADHVVVATGAYQCPYVPEFAAELDPRIMQVHSSSYKAPAQLRPGNVLVVGAGNSGADIALELSRTHQTWLSGRYPGVEPTRPGSVPDRLFVPLFWFVVNHVLTVSNPLGRKVRSKLLGRGIPLARVKPSDLKTAGVEHVPRTVSVQDGAPVLEDSRVLDVANVVWCTGFRYDFGWIDLPIFGEDGEPVHERGMVAGEPGLYFVGLFFLYSAASPLVGGVGRDGEYIATAIASRRSASSRRLNRFQRANT